METQFNNTSQGLQVTFPNGFKLSLALPGKTEALGADFMVFDPDDEAVNQVEGFELNGEFKNSGWVSPRRLPALVITVALMHQ